MERHLKLAAYLNFAFYGVLLAVIVYSYLNNTTASTTGLNLATVGYAVFLYAPYFIGAFGLLKRWPWSRTVMMILSALALLNLFQMRLLSLMQLGSLIGIYTIWVLWQEQTVKLLVPKQS